MRVARLLAGLILAGSVAAACSSGSSDDGVRATTPTSTAPPATAIQTEDLVGQPQGRVLLEVLYRLVVAEGGCGDREVEAPEAEGAFAPQLDAVFDALTELATVCDDPAGWSASMVPVIDRLGELDAALREAEGLSAQQSEELPATDRPVDLGPSAVRAVERLHLTLRDSNEVDASDLWFSSQHLGLTSTFREVVASGSLPGTVVVGSSIVYRGVDETALGEGAVNAAMTGAGPQVTAGWVDELGLLGLGDAHLVWATSSHELHVCDLPGRIRDPRELRTNAFAPLADSGEITRLDWVLGPVGTPVSSRSPIGAHWLEAYDGVDPAFDATDPERVATQRGRLDAYDEPEVCSGNVDAIVRATTDARAAGARVSVVAMPIGAEVIEAHPDGAAGHAAALDQLFSRLDPGVEVHDLSTPPPDDHFVDLVHLSRTGRAELSAALAAALASEA